ncbi:hypothetical protein RhoFasSB10_00379 [Rhodococcus fascians]|uniref:ATP-binding protein n=1 Tax=Rhodococcoides fascians TaxID=1828 RepID=UPI001427B1DC|nr:hypothetical protein [Rhodococcus fascians]
MTLKQHPFSPDRQIGVVFAVEGSFADVTFDAAALLPRNHFGEHLGRGEVGEFVIVDVSGTAIFGRVLSVGTRIENVGTIANQDRPIPVTGRLQLLSTLGLDGTSTRGISRYPRVSDRVYAASGESILTVLDAVGDARDAIFLGQLSVDESIRVAVPLERLFGRHLAIVGATGSGKSWSLAHLTESVGQAGGKLLLIDATGEYRTLAGRGVVHAALGGNDGEPTGTQLVGIPHYAMRETERNAFLTPSSGSQLPKLREAIRSLRLAAAIMGDTSNPTHNGLVSADGVIKKAGVSLGAIGSAWKQYVAQIENPHQPFDLNLLSKQIQLECVWPTSRHDSAKFGDLDYAQIGYVSSLVSRINDLVQTPEIMQVISPNIGVGDLLSLITSWVGDSDSQILRVSLRNLTFANHLREIVVNIIGQSLLNAARAEKFRTYPHVVAVDEAHQFFDVTVGDEFANARLNAFDSIAKEGRKYGLTVCLATQRPGDLPPGVLSQVGMTIVHRLADGRDRQRVEQAAAELDYSATRLLPGLVPGEAILMGVDFPVPVSVRMQRPKCPPASDGPAYLNWSVPSG